MYLHLMVKLTLGQRLNGCGSKVNKIVLPVLHPFSKGHYFFLIIMPTAQSIIINTELLSLNSIKLRICLIKDIDIIFTPLVAFDHAGQRLGMGGGYYNRTLEQWFNTGIGPLPIGLAHDCQQVERIPVEDWDIPLPIFVTPSKIWHWEK